MYYWKPLSYVTAGQNVPDDIEVADTANIAKDMFQQKTRYCMKEIIEFY